MALKTLSLVFRETIQSRILAEFNHHPLLGLFVYNKGFALGALTYIPAMITHTIDAISKIIFTTSYLAFAISASLAVILTFGRSKFLKQASKNTWLLALDGILVIGIDIVGMIIPPLAYRLDNLVIEKFTKKIFPMLQNPYQEGSW